tara:strand:- start:932 stop:1534 length:603 start_codon:yes stop_codon:yes gene_type:complete
MNSETNIYQRINKVMKEVEYIKRGSAGQGTGVKYDEAISKLRQSMILNGIVMVPRQVGTTSMIREPQQNGQKMTQPIYTSDYEVDLVNMDNPSDKVTYTQTAHAMDNGDKAPGKISTYACKVVLIKAFALETGENDESRAEQNDVDFISIEQQGQLYDLLVDPQSGSLTSKGQQIAGAFKFNLISEIKSKKFDAILKAAS